MKDGTRHAFIAMPCTRVRVSRVVLSKDDEREGKAISGKRCLLRLTGGDVEVDMHE